MLPKKPPRAGQVGFIYVPPFRIQGISVAGEQTVIQIPELDVAFDIGLCPRIALASPYIALTHGHMDHVGGLPYYFSQRVFQRMGVGTCVCHSALAPALTKMMEAWIEVEQQRTPYNIMPLSHNEQLEVKNNIFLRAIEVSHTVPALGYSLIEKRSKLRDEFRELPQERLRELKAKGEQITRTLEIPLVACTGDTEIGPFLYRNEFAAAKVVICECTFFNEDHFDRAKIGKHLHIRELAQLLEIWEAEAVILTHITRRTSIEEVRTIMSTVLRPEDLPRVHLLMDHRANSERYEQQRQALEADEVEV